MEKGSSGDQSLRLRGPHLTPTMPQTASSRELAEPCTPRGWGGRGRRRWPRGLTPLVSRLSLEPPLCQRLRREIHLHSRRGLVFKQATPISGLSLAELAQ